VVAELGVARAVSVRAVAREAREARDRDARAVAKETKETKEISVVVSSPSSMALTLPALFPAA
jgi:hypothetical protein